MPSGGRRGCRRRQGYLPTPLSPRAARPHSGVRPPRSESRPKRTSSCSRSVLYFWLCKWSRRENILRAEPPRDTPDTEATLTPQPHTRQAGRLPAPAPRRTPLGAGGEGPGSLRLRHRRPARADGREDPAGPHRRRPGSQQVPEHDGQAGSTRSVLRLDETPPRGRARPRERSPAGHRLQGGHLPRSPVYERGTLLAGGESLPVELKWENGFLLQPEAISSERTRILWINYPHNPTGATATYEYLESMVEFCRRNGILLFSDECYNDIYSGEPPSSILEITTERTLAFCSLSKRSGMTGYRSAMMAGDPELIGALKKLRPSIGVATQSFVQDAATAAWDDDAHVEKRRRVFGEKRDLFTAFFERAGLQYLSTEASFYLWVAVPDWDDEAYALRLMEEGVIVAPGRAFGAGGEGYVRIALVPALEDCKLAIPRWARIEGLA